MAGENKRKVAKKIFVNDILKSTYIKRPGWEPSGILTKLGEISRVDIMGVIVSKTNEGNSSTLLIDDGTGNIQIRLFDDSIDISKLELGDMVSVIGRPREWESSKYIVPEIIKKTQDKNWFRVHQLEIKLQKKKSPIKLPVEQAENPEAEDETGPYQKILNAIAILDKGNGVDIDEIINNVKIERCDSLITSLIEEGELFEISPGKVKLLE